MRAQMENTALRTPAQLQKRGVRAPGWGRVAHAHTHMLPLQGRQLALRGTYLQRRLPGPGPALRAADPFLRIR
jgi:hypothetical protein